MGRHDACERFAGGGRDRGQPGGRRPALAPAIEAAIRARIDVAREGVLACAGSERAAVLAHHDAGAGTIRFSLRGDDTPAVTRCIEMAVGDITVYAGWPPFDLLHPLVP